MTTRVASAGSGSSRGSARSVRRAHQQVDLLAVELLALDLQPDVADDDDRALRARHLHGEIDDGRRLRGSGDQRAVGAAAAGRIAYCGLERVAVTGPSAHAERERARDARRIE